MIIYNPHNEILLKERISLAEGLLSKIPAKYCFITGSFLYKKNYKDIDLFVVSRTKKRMVAPNKKVKITLIDFNDLYSLFYHSVSKSCVAKNILPEKTLKVTLSDYWQVINEAIPTILNQKDKYHKHIRSLVLYTEYFKSGEVLDTFQLKEKINEFKEFQEILKYAKEEVSKAIGRNAKRSYARKFFYTQTGYYRDLREYKAQSFLYDLAHEAVRVAVHG